MSGILVSIFKMDQKCRKYVEVFAIPKENKDKVSELLENVNIDTPEDEVRMLFKGLCDVRTKSDFKKIRRKRILFNTFFYVVILTLSILCLYRF